ncbi:MAG: hypothetical protein ACNA8H_06815 [Anaerolineales bacterium]
MINFLIGLIGLVAAYVLWQYYQEEGGFYAIYVAIAALLSGLLALRNWLGKDQPEKREKLPSITTLQSQRIRENLINTVHSIWIDDYLKKSIHSEVIKLLLSYRSEAVEQRPWQMVLHQPDRQDIPLSPDRSLLEIFIASGRNLLILGEPGCGKTTTMLQLAEELLATARSNPDAPLPIILNLSSWGQKKKEFDQWLVEEIFLQYAISRDIARAGIANESFLSQVVSLPPFDFLASFFNFHRNVKLVNTLIKILLLRASRSELISSAIL